MVVVVGGCNEEVITPHLAAWEETLKDPRLKLILTESRHSPSISFAAIKSTPKKRAGYLLIKPWTCDKGFGP